MRRVTPLITIFSAAIATGCVTPRGQKPITLEDQLPTTIRTTSGGLCYTPKDEDKRPLPPRLNKAEGQSTTQSNEENIGYCVKSKKGGNTITIELPLP